MSARKEQRQEPIRWAANTARVKASINTLHNVTVLSTPGEDTLPKIYVAALNTLRTRIELISQNAIAPRGMPIRRRNDLLGSGMRGAGQVGAFDRMLKVRA